MTAIMDPKTYVEYYQNSNVNPFGAGDSRKAVLQTVYHNWRSAAAPLNREELFSITKNQFDAAVGGIGLFVKDPAGILRLRIIHGLRKFTGDLQNTSPLINEVFGYLDDVDEGETEIVQFDDTVLGITAEINVCTVAHHKIVLEGDDTIDLLPGRADGEPQTVAIRARKSAFIPFELMPYLLEKNFNPRQAFLVIDAYLQSHGLATECGPLLDFLRVAGTLPLVGLEPLVAHSQPGTTARIEKGLVRFMKQKVLFRDLPSYQRRTQRSDPATAALTAAVNTMAATQLRADEANERRRDDSDRPTTVIEAFGEDTSARLLTLAHVDEVDLLPILWTNLAAKKKRQDYQSIVQQAVDGAARSMKRLQGPTVSTATLAFIKTIRLQGNDPSDVGSGVLPMAFVPPGGASPRARMRLAEESANVSSYQNMMSTEGQHITSADAKELAKVKGFVAGIWTEATVQLDSYLYVLIALLGANHPLTVAYRNGIEFLDRHLLVIQQAFDIKVGTKLAPALLVYCFQLKVRAWFDEQLLSEYHVPVPIFNDDLRRFIYSKNLDWLPDVSDVPELAILRRPTTLPYGNGNGSGGGSSGSGVSGSGGGSGGGISGQGKGGPKRDLQGTPTRPGTQLGERKANPDWDSRFQQDNEFCRRVKMWKVSKAIAIMKERCSKPSPPAAMLADGVRDRCVTWHAKGFCFTHCKCLYDHNPLSTSEKDTFFEWCRDAYQ